MFPAPLVLLLLGLSAGGKLTMNNPESIVSCETDTLSWNGGTAPYNLYG